MAVFDYRHLRRDLATEAEQLQRSPKAKQSLEHVIDLLDIGLLGKPKQKIDAGLQGADSYDNLLENELNTYILEPRNKPSFNQVEQIELDNAPIANDEDPIIDILFDDENNPPRENILVNEKLRHETIPSALNIDPKQQHDETLLLNLLQLTTCYDKQKKPEARQYFESLMNALNDSQLNLSARTKTIKPFLPLLMHYGKIRQRGIFRVLKYINIKRDEWRLIRSFFEDLMRDLINEITRLQALSPQEKSANYLTLLNLMQTVRTLIPYYHKLEVARVRGDQPILTVPQIIETLKNASQMALTTNPSDFAHQVALRKLLPYCHKSYRSADYRQEILNSLEISCQTVVANNPLPYKKRLKVCEEYIIQQKKSRNQNLQTLRMLVDEYERSLSVNGFDRARAEQNIYHQLDPAILNTLGPRVHEPQTSNEFLRFIHHYVQTAANAYSWKSSQFMLSLAHHQTEIVHLAIRRILNEVLSEHTIKMAINKQAVLQGLGIDDINNLTNHHIKTILENEALKSHFSVHELTLLTHYEAQTIAEQNIKTIINKAAVLQILEIPHIDNLTNHHIELILQNAAFNEHFNAEELTSITQYLKDKTRTTNAANEVIFHLQHTGNLNGLTTDLTNFPSADILAHIVDEFNQKQIDALELDAHHQLMQMYDDLGNKRERKLHSNAIKTKLNLSRAQRLNLWTRNVLSKIPIVNFFFDNVEKKITEKLTRNTHIALSNAPDKNFALMVTAIKRIYDNPALAIDPAFPHDETDVNSIKAQAQNLLLNLHNNHHIDFIDHSTLTSLHLKHIVQLYKAPKTKDIVLEALWQQYQICSHRKARHAIEEKLTQLLGLPTKTTSLLTRLKSWIPADLIFLTWLIPLPFTEAIAGYFKSPKRIIQSAMFKQGYEAVAIEDGRILAIPGTTWLKKNYKLVHSGITAVIKWFGIGMANYQDQEDLVNNTKIRLLNEYKKLCKKSVENKEKIWNIQFLLMHFNKHQDFGKFELDNGTPRFRLDDDNNHNWNPITSEISAIINNYKTKSTQKKNLFNNARFTIGVVSREYALLPRLTSYFKKKQFDEKFYDILKYLLKFGGISYLNELKDRFFPANAINLTEDEYQQRMNQFIDYVIDDVILRSQSINYDRAGFSLSRLRLMATLNNFKKAVNRYTEVTKSTHALARTPEEKKLYKSCDSLINQLPFGPERARLEKILDEDITLEEDNNALEEIRALYQKIKERLQANNIAFIENRIANMRASSFRRTYKDCQHLLHYFQGHLRPGDPARRELEDEFNNIALNVKKSHAEKLRILREEILNTFRQERRDFYIQDFTFEKIERTDISHEKQELRYRKRFWKRFAYGGTGVLSLGQASLSLYAVGFGAMIILGPFSWIAGGVAFFACLYTNFFLFFGATDGTLQQLLIKKDYFNGFTSKEGKIFAVLVPGGLATSMATTMAFIVAASVIAIPGLDILFAISFAFVLSTTSFIGFTSLMYVTISNLVKGFCNKLVWIFPEIEEQGWGLKGILKGMKLGSIRMYKFIVTPHAYSKHGGVFNAITETFRRIGAYWKNPFGITNLEIYKPVIIRNLRYEFEFKIKHGGHFHPDRDIEQTLLRAAAIVILKLRNQQSTDENLIKLVMLHITTCQIVDNEEIKTAVELMSNLRLHDNVFVEMKLAEEFHKQVVLKRLDIITKTIIKPFFYAAVAGLFWFATLSNVVAWNAEMIDFLTNNSFYHFSAALAKAVSFTVVICCAGIVEGIFNLRNLSILFDRMANVAAEFIGRPLITWVGAKIFRSKDCQVALDKLHENVRHWFRVKKERRKETWNNFIKDPKRGMFHIFKEAKKILVDVGFVIVNAIGTAFLVFKHHAFKKDPFTGEMIPKDLSEISWKGYVDTASANAASDACNGNELIDIAAQSELDYIPEMKAVEESEWVLEQEHIAARKKLYEEPAPKPARDPGAIAHHPSLFAPLIEEDNYDDIIQGTVQLPQGPQENLKLSR